MTSFAQHKVLKEEPPYYEKSPRFSYATTVFGGVAGTGKLLGLGTEQMSNAFGIAGASTAVPATMKWQYMSGPSIMSKYNAWTGWIAQLATVAALAAEKGFTGDTTILDGEWGYWKIVGSPFFKVDNLLGKLGEMWHIGEVEFKLYPTCYIFHTAIEGISNMMKEHGIRPEDVEEIVVKGDPLATTPNRMHREVKSFADAQFSILYNFALAVYYGDSPGPAWQMPTTFNDPRVKELMGKVKIDVHPQFDEFVTSRIKTGRLPIMWGSIVEIAAKGKRFTTEVEVPKGSKGNPATETELVDKFKMNASYSMIRSGKVEKVIEIVNHLDEIDDVGKLFTLLKL
jgi:2-methylcitrate dehydratase PrpD